MPGSRWTRRSSWAPRRPTTTRSPTSWTCGPTRACRSSASAHARPEIAAPVDLYLEGSDQHRGWFHSSLLMSEALYERAPVPRRAHPRLHGRREGPQDVEVARQRHRAAEGDEHARRRHAAAVGRGHRLRQRDQRLGRDPEAHGRLLPPHAQHRCASCSATCTASIPQRHAVPPAELVALDRWALARTRAAAGGDRRRPTATTSSTSIYQKVHNFCIVDLGGFYLDVIKDRLYTTPRGQPRAPLGADRDVPHRREPWCAGWRRSCRSRPKRCGATCPGHAPRVVFLDDLASAAGGGRATAIDWDALMRLRSRRHARAGEAARHAARSARRSMREVDVYCTAR